MKRKIDINGIVGGTEMEAIVDIIPQLKDSFRQRKHFFEFFFSETEAEITLEQIDKLTQFSSIKIGFDWIRIEL